MILSPRSMLLLGLAAAALVVTTGSGCSYHLVSPPAHVVNLESAAPVHPGETMVGAHGGAFTAVFDPGAAVASGGVRHGVVEGVEIDGEATYARILTDDSPDIDRNLFAARAGTKIGNKYFAATGGVGGGFASAAGSFAAFDLGGIASYPNCYVIPLVAPSAFVSAPFAARTVTFDNGNTSKAATSYGFGVAAGVEIPLDRARCREGRTPARLQLGANLFSITSVDQPVTMTTTTMSDGGTTTTTTRSSNTYGAMGLVIGIEVPL